ncbi:uncharacterized protein LOC123978367 [Micropterus dolomieu]|uniref:uncharacterized protein LOC123978367 n=1 Tax=Micropterus dolomieu TaxID=147949 RepID=UPI001E8D2FBA|nr:uncharacterized protein LOC123978367 [Micropterus dolomieu]
MTEHQDADKVTLNCSVSTDEQCRHTVKWLYEGKDVDKDNQDLKTSQYSCNASVSFLTSHYIYTSRHNQFSCEVTDGDNVQVFPFRFLPSGEKPDWWWLYIIVTVALVALLIIVVKVIRWKRAKGNKAGMNDNIWLTSDPAVTESAPENTVIGSTHSPVLTKGADPEDGVTYATVSFTAKTNSEGRVQSKNDADEGDAVTYMTMKASSADPSNLYATIN